MGLKRPATKVPFWTPRVRNRPDVEPPGLLRLVSALAICSVVGVLVYSVAQVVAAGTPGGPYGAAYIALLHFLLPFGIAFTVGTNSPLSRLVILVYVLVYAVATVLGIGYLAQQVDDPTFRAAGAAAVVIVVAYWLFRSAKMRYYYLMLRDKPIPAGLAMREHELAGRNWIGPRTRATIEWVADHLETVVLIGFVIVVLYAFSITYSYQ